MKSNTGIRMMLLAGCVAGMTLHTMGETKSHVPPRPRLQIDIGEGSSDLQWWRDGQATKEDRLGEWRDARFGCFIHWGASAVLGSSWNGKAYGGYGEHIQRMAKIPCEEYREKVVGSFNPIKFDADEWARIIKAAGMRYVIITAKHHDGFAMFDSDASDYNVVDATPFGRDPMAELKAACDKYGLEFGFYYSHAFDWGEPNGSGNDWDYENPGGDRHLFAEKNKKWFDVHPEIAPRIRTYVDEKSIPQVIELVTKYDPDFLWFDTPHKLPPEENLRILKAARTAKPSIVINSRVVSGYEGMPAPGHFGDYASTGDRAVDFRKKEGDWEAIPTTNESYGYNANDDSHKTPEFLVEVLVKAAARGGNMLLNIGPKGDGEIDSIDLNILAGIGKWMDVNEASIRGTVRTTLPVQAWGESTRKGNLLYLHVFDWPRDGQLEVGGFLGGVKKAWLLSDTNQTALKHQRVDEKTVQVAVPRNAPDSTDSVIVLEVDDAEQTSKQRLLSATQPNMLRAFDAIAEGGTFKYGNGKALDNGVSGWKSEDQKLTWPVYLLKAGTYAVEAEYSLKESAPVNTYRVKVGGSTLTAETQGAGAHKNVIFVKHELGTIEIPKGENMVEILPEGTPNGDLMKLRAVHLTPISNEKDEPNTAEAAKADHPPERDFGYDVSGLSSDQLAWANLLRLHLEDFYYSGYLKSQKKGEETSWDFAEDVPGLPRVLIIGDSISRGYTLPLRHELEGKANVHRAPENCSSTVVGLEKLDVWLGDKKWDLITFNFGIHDRHGSSTDYGMRLRQIVDRLKKTDAKLVWITTTSIPEGEDDYVEGAIEGLNKVAKAIMTEQSIPVLDLYQAVTPKIAQYQRPNNCHFRESGYDFMGSFLAEGILTELQTDGSRRD